MIKTPTAAPWIERGKKGNARKAPKPRKGEDDVRDLKKKIKGGKLGFSQTGGGKRRIPLENKKDKTEIRKRPAAKNT